MSNEYVGGGVGGLSVADTQLSQSVPGSEPKNVSWFLHLIV